MTRQLSLQNLKDYSICTHEGASAYDYRESHPLIHLTFTMGSALFVEGFYTSEPQQVREFARALVAAAEVEPRFPWQYAHWMRAPRKGKGNRIQGSLAPALLDGLLGQRDWSEEYVFRCLRFRPDDVTAFLAHYVQLGLGEPSAAARRGMARALCAFDEYQLMKYADEKKDLRLCDAIFLVRAELEALGAEAELVLDAGRYLHASSRNRAALAKRLPLTAARKSLWQKPEGYVSSPEFLHHLAGARVTWEQVLSHFGTNLDRDELSGAERARARRRNKRIWQALLSIDGLLGEMALLRNLRNMNEAGLGVTELCRQMEQHDFSSVWPHQVYAGFKAAPQLRSAFDVAFSKMAAHLPPGRHLGIGDASGSMSVPVGGPMSSMTAMDVAFCLVGLMSETSALGASFCDDSMIGWSPGSYLSIAERTSESALEFSQNEMVRRAWGGTQVAGAVLELINWLQKRRHIEPPDCLWFFSDMQFHPAATALRLPVPKAIEKAARQAGLGTGKPPLEMALETYRSLIGPVDVVLWNLAAYAPVPVPASIDGVLLVSGFDQNTFRQVEKWRSGEVQRSSVAESQEVILEKIRSF